MCCISLPSLDPYLCRRHHENIPFYPPHAVVRLSAPSPGVAKAGGTCYRRTIQYIIISSRGVLLLLQICTIYRRCHRDDMQPTTTTEIIIYNSGQSDPPLEVRTAQSTDMIWWCCHGPKTQTIWCGRRCQPSTYSIIIISIVHVLSESIASLREIDIYLIDKVYWNTPDLKNFWVPYN